MALVVLKIVGPVYRDAGSITTRPLRHLVASYEPDQNPNLLKSPICNIQSGSHVFCPEIRNHSSDDFVQPHFLFACQVGGLCQFSSKSDELHFSNNPLKSISTIAGFLRHVTIGEQFDQLVVIRMAN